jgi:hypothetical protein
MNNKASSKFGKEVLTWIAAWMLAVGSAGFAAADGDMGAFPPSGGAVAGFQCPSGQIAVPGPAPASFLNFFGGASINAKFHCIPFPQPPGACPGGGQPTPDPAMSADLENSGETLGHWVCPQIGIGDWCPHIVGPIYPMAQPSPWFVNPSGSIQPNIVMGRCPVPRGFLASGPIMTPGMTVAGAGGASSFNGPPNTPGAFPQPFRWCRAFVGGIIGGFAVPVPETLMGVCSTGESAHYFQFPPVNNQVAGASSPLEGPEQNPLQSAFTGFFGDISKKASFIENFFSSAESSFANFF